MERIFCAIIIIGSLYGFTMWARDIFRFVHGLIDRRLK